MGTNETTAQEAYNQFWPKATEEIRAMGNAGLKHQELPLARIKKVSYLVFSVKSKTNNSFLKKENKLRIEDIILLFFRETRNKHRVNGQSKFHQNESFFDWPAKIIYFSVIKLHNFFSFLLDYEIR